MSYIVGTKQYMIDLETFKFVKYESGAGLDILRPFYMYEMRVQYPDNERRTNVVSLNGLDIEFLDHKAWNLGDCKAVLHFEDKHGAFHVIGMKVQHNVIGPDLVFYYESTVDGKIDQGSMTLRNPFVGEIKFQYIPGLGRQYSGELKNSKLHYGIRPKQYAVEYNGKRLGGTSYVMLCGAWAVLLDDNLSFDAVALLNNAQSEIIGVERFIYTDNPYITKLMMLSK